MHTMYILCSAKDAVSSGNWPILFKVLTLNSPMYTVFLHLINFGLGSVADFSNMRARALTSAERAPFTARRAMWFGYMV